jgi:hypothetical protein
MSLEVRIEGAASFKALAARMRAEGDKNLASQMARALGRAAEPVKVAIRKEAQQTMPHSGGYSALLTASLRHRMSRRLGGQQASLIINTYADGTKNRRDIVALNRGTLRHPVFGRSRSGRRGERRANPWAVTTIEAGFHQRGTKDALELAQNELMDVVEDYAGRLAGQ